MFWPLLYQFMESQQPIVWNTLVQNADPWVLTIPPYGRHCLIEGQWRSAQGTGSAINLQNFVNADTTTGNYHGQRHLASNNAASAVEVSGANGGQVAGGTAPAGVYSSWFWFCPNFQEPGRQRVWHVIWTHEDSAGAQQIAHHVSKRTTAGVGGLTDVAGVVQFSNALANIMDGVCRIGVV